MSISKIVAVIVSGVALAIGLAGSAFADNWEAVKLRGAVFTLVDNAWVQLGRGDIVPDDRVIRTAGNGRVQFKRDNETIDLGPNTQIRIFDRNGQKYTVVQEHFGDVAIEAERKQVQHFVVQTEFLAAVVKGTRFTVKANENGANVSVQRGVVEVRDTKRNLMVDITPGQHAGVGKAEMLNVGGTGTLPTVVAYTGNALAEDVANITTDSSTSSDSSTSTTDTVDTGTPAVANTADTPAASVVASTPAATKTPPGQAKK